MRHGRDMCACIGGFYGGRSAIAFPGDDIGGLDTGLDGERADKDMAMKELVFRLVN